MSNINIQPFQQTTTNYITSFNVECRSLDLFNSASFNVNTYDASGNFISRQIITLTNEQYLEWQNNDQYVINLVATELGFTIIPSS